MENFCIHLKAQTYLVFSRGIYSIFLLYLKFFCILVSNVSLLIFLQFDGVSGKLLASGFEFGYNIVR